MSLELSQFENLVKALPTKKEEAWKYTSLTDFKNTAWQFSYSNENQGLTHDELSYLSQQLPSEFINFVFVNGEFNTTLSDHLDSQMAVVLVDEQDQVVAEEHVEKGILHLANAVLKNKLQIKIADHEVFEKPVHVLFVQNPRQPAFFSEKVEVLVGKNSELSLITQTLTLGEASQSAVNLNLELKLEENAKVKLIELQNDNLSSYHFSQSTVKLASDSHLHALTLTLGAHLCRNYFHLEFLGQGADAGVYGLSALAQKQHADQYTFIQHTVGGNNSRQLYKSILSDASHSVFRGRVRIERDAQKANSEQLNNNLLLTRQAQADTIPQLEIYADDVKAGHGATVGQLNRDEIFYFLSRGINQHQAVKMLSFGYAQELIYQFENKDIQNWLLKKLNQKLDGMIHV